MTNGTKVLTGLAALTFVLFLFLTLSLAPSMAGNVNYTYDNAGRLTRVDYDNGVTIQYTYDNAGNLLSRVVTSGEPGTYTVTVNKAGTGSGTVTGPGVNCGSDCSEAYAEGKSVTLKAKADPGSTFKGWSGGYTGTGASCKLKMSANQTVTATFALPDLRGELSNIAVKQSKTTYEVSGKLSVYADDGKAAGVKAKVYLSEDGSYDESDTALGGLVNIGTVNAGASKSKTVKYKVATNPSNKYLIVKIDPDGLVAESNEGNNTVAGQIPSLP